MCGGTSGVRTTTRPATSQMVCALAATLKKKRGFRCRNSVSITRQPSSPGTGRSWNANVARLRK